MQFTREPQWYKDAIIYELNIKGFYDSNGDGIGDFAGLRKKLDYLEDLGVTAIWLLPFYPSPLRDDGYDISDYYTISEAYGNLEDFRLFLDEAHHRGLKVITELVINHTSDRHPWFQRARQAPAGSPERNYYVWSDSPEKYKDVRIIFQDFETSNWTWDPVAKAYYWHRFYAHQPDLNFDSPDVVREIFDLLSYWADMGIDGFRLDAIPYLFEREGTNCENLPETHVFLKKLRSYIDERYDNILFLAEANMWPEDSAAYFGEGDECHMNYHFPLMPRLYMSVKMEDRHPITDIFDQTPEIPDSCQWATFLRNHDELTLEMVTDEERDFMYKVYAKDNSARINLGIRRRLAPLMDNDRNRIELLNILLLSLPGTPVLYYGDEIGMGDNFYLGDRNGVRTPMQWTNGENAGFSEANPHRLYLPVIRDPEYSYRSINVTQQQMNQNSLLWWTKRVLAKRKSFKVFGRGDLRFLQPENGKVLAFLRSYEEETMLVVVNLSRYAQAVQLDLADYAGHQVMEVFGHNAFPAITRESYSLTLSPYGYYWLQLEAVAWDGGPRDLPSEPAFALDSLDRFFSKAVVQQLEERTLPLYLRHVNWLGFQPRVIEKIRLADYWLLQHEDIYFAWLFIEVNYKEGLPEWLQLPLAFHPMRDAHEEQHEEAIVGRFQLAERDMLMVDALYDPDFRYYLATGFQQFEGAEKLTFIGSEQVAALGDREMPTERSELEYMLLAYRELIVKFPRRIDPVDYPGLEVEKALHGVGFPYSPNPLGSLQYRLYTHAPSTLVIYEKRVLTQGTAWQFVTDNLTRFAEEILARYPQLSEEPVPEVPLTGEMHYQQMPAPIQELLGSSFVMRIARLGKRAAMLHQALAGIDQPDFTPEPLSLHYQRSLFAGLKGSVRTTVAQLKRHLRRIDGEEAGAIQQLIDREEDILRLLKRIFQHKIDAVKIRNHGDLTLDQVSLQGEDFLFHHFSGDTELPFSQRRLRRSPAKDLANLLRSLDYAYRYVLAWQTELQQERYDYLHRWLRLAYQCLAAELLTAYRIQVNDDQLLPAGTDDLQTLLTTFSIEKALQEIRYDLHHRPDWLMIPVTGLLEILAMEN